jgi:hypothetical protein
VSLRLAIVSAAPAALLALCALLPFLSKPFTVDDVTFLLQAKHVLVDPLHPTAFDMVFHGERIRLSEYLVTGPVMAYLLVPSVLLGGAECVIHALQAALVAVTAIATSALALRLQLDGTQARIAALLVVASPAVVGMGSTAMPDVPAMAFGVTGMERFVVWRQTGRWTTGLMASILLALAALARPHVLLLVPCAAVWLLKDEDWRLPRRWFSERVGKSVTPLILALALFVIAVVATRDPASGETVAGATAMRIDIANVAFNLGSFAVHWVVAFPLGLLWPVLRGSDFLKVRRTYAAFGIGVILLIAGRDHMIPDLRWTFVMMLAAGHGIDVLADIAYDTWRRRDRVQLFLVAWLFVAAASATYVQLPIKVLIPSAPAMAILLARRMTLEKRRRMEMALVGGVVILGLFLGVLVLRADAAMGEVGRQGGRIVASLIGRAEPGKTVWIDGAWGYQWYAMEAGAKVMADSPPFPRDGDLVVSSLDAKLVPFFLPNRTLLYRKVFSEPGGRVFGEGAGFFSNLIGLSPWVWGHRELGRIEVWRIDPKPLGLR